MKVSIITVTYNSSATLGDTLQSVASQKYSDIEHIIIDGASTDDTLKIVEQYSNNIACLVSEPDKGIYDAMNKGLMLVTGDIVGILNSDDIYMDELVITDVVACFMANPDTDAVFASLCFVKPTDMTSVVRIWKGSPYYPGAFSKGWHPAHPTFFVRRSVYAKYGCFDLDFDVSADFELMLRLIEKHRIKTHFLNRTIVCMRMGGESTGSIQKIIKGNRNVVRAFHKNGLSVSPFYPLMRILPKVWNVLKLKLQIT